MTDFSLESLAAIEPKDFAQVVKATPDATIVEVMAGPDRDKILDAIFDRMPTLFRADKAGATQAVIHWKITGGTAPNVYETVIENGTCTVTGTPARDPKLSLTMDALTLMKVISGEGNPTTLVMTGKVKPKGDLSVAFQIAKLFDIPKA